MQPPNSADSRHISAFVLVEPTDRIDSLTRTLHSLQGQTRPADRVILGLNFGCSEEMRDFARAAAGVAPHTDSPETRERYSVDGYVEAISESSLADMAKLFADENERCTEREHADDEDRERAQEANEREQERATQGARDFTILTPSQRKATAEGSTHTSRGRRARHVDHELQTREHEKTAQAEALIPERLRRGENRGSPGGRRRATVAADQKWLWFLTADSSPTPETLQQLVEALDRTPTLALVGPKHLAVEDVDESTSRIVDLGITLTRSNRMVTSVEPGEIDQGQADWRSDVLAVALPGMLVREATLNRLGGFDSMLTSPWAEIDVSQRVWRSGERVQVVPSAAAHTPLEVVDETVSSDFRTSQVLSLLKFRAFGWALLTLLAFPLTTLGRVVRGIFRHDASAVFREMRAFMRVLARAPRALFAGRSTSSTIRVSRRRLAPLYMPWSVAARERIDSWWTFLFSDDERSRNIRRSTWGVSGTHHGMDDADYGRHTVWTVIVGLVSTACGIAAVRSLLRPGAIAGGALVAPSAQPEDARDAIFSSWIPSSLGSAGPSDPFVRLMGHLPVSGETIVLALYLVIIPVTALIAWYSAGTISRSIVVRLIATLMWLSAPPFVHAFTEGRWTLLLVHALLPLAAQCLGRAIGLPHKVSQASIAAAAGGGLIVGVISSIQPVIGLVLLMGLLLVAPWVPGRRKRLWWFAVPTAAALFPNILGYIRHPESILTPVGMPFAFERAHGLAMFAFAPSAEDPAALALGVQPSWWTVLLAAAPLMIAAVCALGAPMLLHTAGIAGRICIIAAAGAFALAFLCVNVVVGIDGAKPFPAYPGAALSLAAAAVITGFICTADAVVRRAHEGGTRGRVAVARIGGTVTFAVSLAIVAGWVVQAPPALQISPTTSPTIPAVAADNGASDVRDRTLVLTQDASGIVTAQPINGGGLSLDQVSSQYLAFQADEAEQGRSYDGAMSALVTATAQNVGATSTQSDSASLGDFGVSYVVVPGDVDTQAQLVDTLNTSPRFEQVTVSESGGLWRVVDPASRADITDASGVRTALSSERTRVVDTLESAPSERTITLAERKDPRWRASVGGTELEPIDSGSWSQEFRVPADVSGPLEIRYSTPLITALILIGYVAIAMSILVAIPWKRRKEYLV